MWALVLSVASIVLTLLFRYWDRVHVDVKVIWPLILPSRAGKSEDGVAIHWLFVTVTNRSRSTGTTVHSVDLQLRMRQRAGVTRKQRSMALPVLNGLPKTKDRLEPGDACDVYTEGKAVLDAIRPLRSLVAESEWKGTEIRVSASHGHGQAVTKWVPIGQALPGSEGL